MIDINEEVVSELMVEFSNYTLTKDDDIMLEECGVAVHSVRKSCSSPIINDATIIDVIIVLSWGIVQHTDWGKSNVLIPINSDGYYFKYYDLEGIVHEVSSPEPGEPIIFDPVKDHSLAPFRKPKHPFIAINVDYLAEDDNAEL